jgi:hypothetical protein
VTLQFAGDPLIMSIVHALPSLHEVGHDAGGSQVSPGSMMPLPHDDEQLLSLVALQPVGQQPSPLMHETIGLWPQLTLHVAAEPLVVSIVQAFPSLHVVGHEAGGSHVSPGSMTPSPHDAEQSLSVGWVQPEGQHESPFMHATMPVWLQATLQLAGLPVMVSMVHAFPSSHVDGQGNAGGSHVSPGSMTPLPQLAEQSLSLIDVHAVGQQPSPFTHIVTAE